MCIKSVKKRWCVNKSKIDKLIKVRRKRTTFTFFSLHILLPPLCHQDFMDLMWMGLDIFISVIINNFFIFHQAHCKSSPNKKVNCYVLDRFGGVLLEADVLALRRPVDEPYHHINPILPRFSKCDISP